MIAVHTGAVGATLVTEQNSNRIDGLKIAAPILTDALGVSRQTLHDIMTLEQQGVTPIFDGEGPAPRAAPAIQHEF